MSKLRCGPSCEAFLAAARKGTAVKKKVGIVRFRHKLGRSLNRTVIDYNAAVGSLERTVLPSARRMAELGLEGEMPPVREVEEAARPLTAPHLVALRDAATA